jgi:hypothetical protein
VDDELATLAQSLPLGGYLSRPGRIAPSVVVAGKRQDRRIVRDHPDIDVRPIESAEFHLTVADDAVPGERPAGWREGGRRIGEHLADREVDVASLLSQVRDAASDHSMHEGHPAGAAELIDHLASPHRFATKAL